MYRARALSFDYVHRFYRQARTTIQKRKGYRPGGGGSDQIRLVAMQAQWDRLVADEFLRLLHEAGITVYTNARDLDAALAIANDE